MTMAFSKMRPALAGLATGLVAGLAGLLGTAAAAEPATITITATYRERIAPPPDAVLDVALLDVSRADAPARTLSQQRFALLGVPMTVTLAFDPALIAPRASYSLRAEVLSGDETLFRTVKATPVLTTPGDLEATLTMVSAAAPPEMAGPGLALDDAEWALFEQRGAPITRDDPPRMLFPETGQVALFGGCNRFSGRVEIDGTALRFPAPMAGTLMACPPEREALERAVMESLPDIRSARRDGALLELRDDAGAIVLRLRALPRSDD
jgi:putative lipoprotein